MKALCFAQSIGEHQEKKRIYTMEHQTQTAVLLKFPATARNSAQGFAERVRFANDVAAIQRVKIAAPATCWYHDEAVAEDSKPS
jgi:hypothetical protein